MSPDVTQWLVAWGNGDDRALERLLPVLYDDLRRRASSYLRRERVDHTLHTTDLVHETYLRLVDQKRVDWRNRCQFFGVASQMMRRILVDHARAKLRGKRGSGARHVSDVDTDISTPTTALPLEQILDIHGALTELEEVKPELAKLVELKFFGGMGVEEISEALELSVATTGRRWRVARAWLTERLSQPGAAG